MYGKLQTRLLRLSVYSLTTLLFCIVVSRWYPPGAMTVLLPFETGSKLLADGHVIDFADPHLLRCALVTILAPILWNIFCRCEHRTRFLTRFFGHKSTAHNFFALYIVCFSAYREHTFKEALLSQPVLQLADAHSNLISRLISCVVGYGLFILGAVISMSGFYRLSVRGTYMGEYFGFFFDDFVCAFPFNIFPDPMYLGSTLMHFGKAVSRGNPAPWSPDFHQAVRWSPAGLVLSALLGWTYWVASKIFEEPFMYDAYAAYHTNKENRKTI
ncbi:Phosphatidyl-N-methylethanolamine N-methyltransferase [Porphyridium purpureum]|uniref:Phosphatidylethanolamine N-methyltransferase n=1 Tax=Porphyridium purpureum TaxID=35688 RepID=A0A5J4YR14_PORPP|nr:Phosphatidyl-N-methylethanolamine N-methyltransferase [Porphyridium purpureum]|eukprot:POR9329..scf229_5